ncbi:MAG TPA: 50S ribosomal protein L32 [Patescibacteria group bacterium]|jgi:large subunit ribosomal protein L32|nr:50S ribosomal protein L32 [Patescibacteria group bacterium]
MAVPKKHKTRSGRNQRRSHDHLFKTHLSICANCHYPVMPHEVCQNCGYFKGKQVIKLKVKKVKV